LLALDFVFGGSKLTVGVIPRAASLKALEDSAISDDGVSVAVTRPVLVDTGATPDDSQIQLSANGLGAVEVLCYAADNVEILLDCLWSGGALLAAHTETARVVKTGGKLYIYGAVGQTVGNPVVDAIIASITLATGDVNTGGVYKVAGTQVVGARGAALTAAAAYGGGVAGATYTATEQGLVNALISQVSNLKTRLDQLASRAQTHGLIA
jgi:hypothetical protein